MEDSVSNIFPYIAGALVTIISFLIKRLFNKRVEKRELIQQAAFCHIELLSIQFQTLLLTLKYLNSDYKHLGLLIKENYDKNLLDKQVEIEHYKQLIAKAKIKLNKTGNLDFFD